MLEVFHRLGLEVHAPADTRVILSHEQRVKGRLRAQSIDGEEVRIFLDRGLPLMVGELLRSDCGRHILVEGAMEAVVTARTDNADVFARACYHLGNRHVKVQLGQQWLRILPDHVLEEMLGMFGMDLVQEQQIFNPESGAYQYVFHHHH